jgi:SAM-dependent methyltransferase
MRRNLPLLVLVLAVAGAVVVFFELSSRRAPDVPFVTTPEEVVDVMIELAEVDEADLVYDLGCGDGRLAIAAARQRGARAVGIDIDPERIRESRANAARQEVRHLVTFRRADLFTADFSQATVVLFYLQPAVNARLLPRLERLRPGVRIVSHQFGLRGIKPRKVVTVLSKQDGLEHLVYLWVTPLEKEGAR